MKKLILLIILIVTFGTVAPAQRGRPAPFTGPVADLVNGIVNAINKQDMAYIQKVVAADAMWADGDIHVLPASFFIGRLLQGNPPKKLAITNLVGQTWDNGAWAAFNYTLDEGTSQMKGINTMTFKKVGNDWQVILIHAARSALIPLPLDLVQPHGLPLLQPQVEQFDGRVFRLQP